MVLSKYRVVAGMNDFGNVEGKKWCQGVGGLFEVGTVDKVWIVEVLK